MIQEPIKRLFRSDWLIISINRYYLTERNYERYKKKRNLLCGFESRTDLKRVRTQSNETVQGKVFVSFISLIVRSYILNNLTKYMRESGYTLKKILLEISKIKSPDMHSENKVCIVNPPTKVQREIYDLLQIELHDCIG